ncbi:hypothetical protein [Pelagibaculum spongiae]|uniref:Lipoprotein n=1 Tax=Pelagibaculum spongiae TaxID=2080658 RepID=A0A2V1GV98_9GAMM|nr:hypothetical protein [Pelagibaculum spongiae]PVZ63422.1 hypothetical protein DC094_21170 [Pelagibaculum spongiae]
MKKIIPALGVLLLAGCATKYVPPQGVDLVEVTYNLSSSPKSGPFFYAPTSVFKFESKDCASPSAIATLKAPDGKIDSITVQVPADQPLINSYSTITQEGSQMVTRITGTEFIPEKNHQYIISVYAFSGALVRDVSLTEQQTINAATEKNEICTF